MNVQKISQEAPCFYLNLDSNLSLYSANEEFYHIFETNSESFAELYQNQFRFALSFHYQAFLLEKLQQCNEYKEIVEIITASGVLKRFWFQVTGRKGKEGTLGEETLCCQLLG